MLVGEFVLFQHLGFFFISSIANAREVGGRLVGGVESVCPAHTQTLKLHTGQVLNAVAAALAQFESIR